MGMSGSFKGVLVHSRILFVSEKYCVSQVQVFEEGPQLRLMSKKFEDLLGR
jgi:hypothetical protein